MIEPFHVDVPSEVIGDLRARLSATRWPAGVADSGGIPLSEMREIARYWRSEFDWRAQEHAINRVPHFRAVSGGLRLHYIHIKASRPGGMPLLLLHGWPGSFVEMLGLLPRLATRSI
jgi:epoxide hydrolase